MSEEMKALNSINAHEQYVKVERDRVWAQGHASGWNSDIDEVLKIWDDIGPNETDVEIGERFRSLKK